MSEHKLPSLENLYQSYLSRHDGNQEFALSDTLSSYLTLTKMDEDLANFYSCVCFHSVAMVRKVEELVVASVLSEIDADLDFAKGLLAAAYVRNDYALKKTRATKFVDAFVSHVEQELQLVPTEAPADLHQIRVSATKIIEARKLK